MNLHLEHLSMSELKEIDSQQLLPPKKYHWNKLQKDTKKIRKAARKRRKYARKLRKPRKINGLDYDTYLLSDTWNRKRLAAFKRAGWKCEVCGKVCRLTGHHKTYERFGSEHPDDILAVCKSCHERLDGKRA